MTARRVWIHYSFEKDYDGDKTCLWWELFPISLTRFSVQNTFALLSHHLQCSHFTQNNFIRKTVLWLALTITSPLSSLSHHIYNTTILFRLLFMTDLLTTYTDQQFSGPRKEVKSTYTTYPWKIVVSFSQNTTSQKTVVYKNDNEKKKVIERVNTCTNN